MSSATLRRLASWIALAAIVAVTLMPTLTRLASVGFDDVDICAADHARSPAPADGGHALEHCPYCALHAELAPPPQPPSTHLRTAPQWRDVPPAFLAAPRATATWSTAHSRAPPLVA